MPDAPTTPATKATAKPPASYPAPTPVQQTQQPAATPTPPPSTPTPPPASPPATPPSNPSPSGDAGDQASMIRQTVQAVVEPFASEMRTALGAANQRIDQAMRPTQTPWAPQAPAVVRAGALGTNAYRYTHVLQCASRQRDWADCPLEGDMHNRLHQAYGTFFANPDFYSGGIIAPFSSRLIADIDPQLAEEVRQASQAGVYGMNVGEVRQIAQHMVAQGHQGSGIAQNLSIYDDTFLGVFLSYAESGEFIAMLKPLEIFSSIGARQVQFLSNGTFPMIEQTGSMIAYWVGKGRTDDDRRLITKSTPRTGGRNLTAKKLACAIDIPSEFARFGAGSIEAFIRADMAAAMATKLDDSIYGGDGTSFEPAGIATNPDILQYTALEGVDGDLFRIEDLEYMVATMQEANMRVTRPTFITRPMLAARIRTRRADAVTADDAAGPYLAANLAMGNNGIGYPLLATTAVPGDRVKGAASDLTQMLLVEPSEIIIARMGVMEFAMTDSHSDNFLRDVKTLRAIQFADAGLRRDEAAVLCDTLIQDDAVFVATT